MANITYTGGISLITKSFRKNIFPLLCTLLMCGCGNQSAQPDTNATSVADTYTSETLLEANTTESLSSFAEKTENVIGTESVSETEIQDISPQILHFVDVYGEKYETEINPAVPKHPYDLDLFLHNGQKLSYDSDSYTSQSGVDVSHHQGEINWNAVKDAGFEFAFIRLGYRGYTSGELCLDRYFFQNIKKAQSCSLDVGIYFFSQAINEQEAIDEANFVIDNLKDYHLDLPVVYDPESILDDDARTDNISGEQFTKNTLAFCKTIQAAGYEPMIYSNMLWEAFELDLSQLTDYPIWYADYEALPQTPYDFTFWQYSNAGSVDGINTSADLNIRLIPKQSK